MRVNDSGIHTASEAEIVRVDNQPLQTIRILTRELGIRKLEGSSDNSRQGYGIASGAGMQVIKPRPDEQFVIVGGSNQESVRADVFRNPVQFIGPNYELRIYDSLIRTRFLEMEVRFEL